MPYLFCDLRATGTISARKNLYGLQAVVSGLDVLETCLYVNCIHDTVDILVCRNAEQSLRITK